VAGALAACGRFHFDAIGDGGAGGGGSGGDGDAAFVTSGCGSVPIRVTAPSAQGYYPALAWSGTEIAVTWTQRATGGDEVHFTRFDRMGNRVGSELTLGNNRSQFDWGARVTWASSVWAIAWADDPASFVNQKLNFARVDASGSLIGSAAQLVNGTGGSMQPQLMWNGTEYGMSWYDTRDGNGEQYFARIDANGAKQGTDLRVTTSNGTSAYGSLAWTGSEWGDAYIDPQGGGETVWYQVITAAGALSGNPQRVVLGGTSLSPTMVWSASDFGLSWNQRGTGMMSTVEFSHADTQGKLVGTTMAVTDSTTVASWASAIAWTGSGYVVAWSEQQTTDALLHLALLDTTGKLVPGTALQLGGPTPQFDVPAVLWLGVPAAAWSQTDDNAVYLYLPC
jgi:hypothetical protein